MNNREEAQQRVDALHAEEAQERALARRLPPGDEQDDHWMRGERLADEAWSLEERFDLVVTPSGLWCD